MRLTLLYRAPQSWPYGGEESMDMLQMTRGSHIGHDSQQ